MKIELPRKPVSEVLRRAGCLFAVRHPALRRTSETGFRAFLIVLCFCAAAHADLPANATVDQTLDALHDRGATLHSFKADLQLTEISNAFNSETVRRGTVTFDQSTQGSPRMRVLFETKKPETGPVRKEEKGYQLDNAWLLDRDYRSKNEVRRQIAHAGEKVNLFQLGKGPFPLPIGQDRERVHDAFDITTVALSATEGPANTVHLQLTPKPNTDLERKFKSLDIWVDRTTTMPVRIKTTDRNDGGTDRVTDLQHMVVNPTPAPTAGDFELPPKEGKWDSHDEPLGN